MSGAGFTPAAVAASGLWWGPTTKPPTAGWTVLGVAHTLSTAGDLRALKPAVAAVAGGHLRTAGSTSYRVEACIGLITPDSSTFGASAGLYLQDADTSDAIGLELRQAYTGDTIINYVIRRPDGANDETGQTLVATLDPAQGYGGRWWFAVEFDDADIGSEVKLEVSADGVNWIRLVTEAEATSFPSGPPDRIYFGAVGASGTEALATLYVFDETPL